MPRYRIQIFKRVGAQGKEYSNVYHFVAPNLTLAEAAASAVAGREVAVNYNVVTFVRARISDETPNSSLFSTIPLNFIGARTPDGELLPPFNTIRVDFTVGGGRPSYKFLRNMITETGYTQGGISPALADFIQENYADALLAQFGDNESPVHMTDEDGLPFSGASVWPLVQMRQTYRRKRRSL